MDSKHTWASITHSKEGLGFCFLTGIVWCKWLIWRPSPLWLCGEPCLWSVKFSNENTWRMHMYIHYEKTASKIVYLQKCVEMGISPFLLSSRIYLGKQEAWGMDMNNYSQLVLYTCLACSFKTDRKLHDRETHSFQTSATFQYIHHPQNYGSIFWLQITVIFGKPLKWSPKNKAVLISQTPSIPIYLLIWTSCLKTYKSETEWKCARQTLLCYPNK